MGHEQTPINHRKAEELRISAGHELSKVATLEASLASMIRVFVNNRFGDLQRLGGKFSEVDELIVRDFGENFKFVDKVLIQTIGPAPTNYSALVTLHGELRLISKDALKDPKIIRDTDLSSTDQIKYGRIALLGMSSLKTE